MPETPRHLHAAQEVAWPSDGHDSPSADCPEVRANFWDYLDGRCCTELAERIRAHLASCGPCIRFRRFQERFFAALGELRDWSPAPARVRHRVRTALAAERATRRW